MKRLLRFPTRAMCWLVLLGLAADTPAQVLQDLTAVLYSTNYERGVNFRALRDGDVPENMVFLNGLAATRGQFVSEISYGAVVRPRPNATLQEGLNYSQNSEFLDLPRASDGNIGIVVVLRSATVGAPTFGGLTPLAFGAVIAPPATDEKGVLLERPTEYWAPEPYASSGDTNAAYYWSPHAQCVFATQPGQVQITWRAARPATISGTNKATIGGLNYAITNVSVVVSGMPVKQPRRLYWTEKSFRATGKAVTVPSSRVGDVYFHYSTNFPRTVAQEFRDLGSTSPADGSASAVLQELRTAWYDSAQGLIQAYNMEGRVFVELLGESTGKSIRRHLGYELVDVMKEPAVANITVELGEKLTAYGDARSDLDLEPGLVISHVGADYTYLDAIGSNGRRDYYAVRETTNRNDVLVHWTQAGVEGLRWPFILARYRQIWPEDPARYSHYLRTAVATQSEAAKTAVPLPADNVPVLQYQDEPSGVKKAFLNEKSEFYSWLRLGDPSHRALLRFQSGEKISFERVLSILNTHIYRGTASDNGVVVGSTDVTGSTDFTVVPDLPGRLTALKLNGTGYGQLPDGVYFNGGSYTVEAWVNVAEVRPWCRLLDFANGPDPSSLSIQLSHFATGKPSAYNQSIGEKSSSVVASPLPLNEWKHMAVVFQADYNRANATLKIYIDGILVGTTTSAYGPQNVTRTKNYIGKSNWPNPTANASLDSIRIWSVARTADQIVEGMNTSAYREGMAGLEAQFTFDGKGPVAFDSSGKGRHMTLFDGASQTLTSYGNTNLPRYVSSAVNIGERINPPTGERGVGAGESYLAGYILQAEGNSFHPAAYFNPFTVGFEAAKLGAIIPVNAIPGRESLEVWWFRQSRTNATKNLQNGFKPIYWPAVVGRYKLVWPNNPKDEIVMASNAGSGALESLQAKGTIYTQNDASLPGYNPNEEHAVMIGGQAYALRDDLNRTAATTPALLTGTDATFSSQPYVLLDYTAEDGRPAVRAFKVLREKPAAGLLFDYVVEAGKQLGAPMPLPMLPAPIEIVVSSTSTNQTNYNKEVFPSTKDKPVGWSDTVASGAYGHYASFTHRDRKQGFWVMRGPHSGLPRLEAGRYDPTRNTFATNVTAGGTLNSAFTNYIHTSRRIDSLVATVTGTPLPAGLRFGPLKDGLAVYGTLTVNTGTYTLIITDADGSTATVVLTLNSAASQQTALNVNNRLGRPPSLAHPPESGQTIPTNAFGMRFYYKTEEGFAWPGLANPPAIGTIVPYLRPVGSTADPASTTTAALDIVYRPVWPQSAPVVDFGETLTDVSRGRPAIRGQTSARILYQQAIATNGVNNGQAVAAMVLHDPTREKSFALKTDATKGLAALPAGVRTEAYQGKNFFPNLPPHLAERFFYDPVRSAKGSLVFKGEFKDELLGEKYLLVNVLAGSDLETVKKLCPATDPDKSKWDTAIDSLAASVETFYENPAVPGQFIVNTNMTVSRGVADLVAITNDATLVDSYALTAAGPGGGFVTIIVGNSGNTQQTPAGEPVSMYVLRVTGSLYRGEVKIIESANPLNELITFEHTADLGGKTAQYEYEWKIAPPVDGFPPVVDATMSRYQPLTNGSDIKRFTLGGSGIRTLVDNYMVMRYRPKNPSHPLLNQWSAWTEPQLAEGWIKRVLAKINPFNQRVTDLYNNSVSTDVSILTQAGKRYEGDIALNMQNINNYGLIEIYETVLNRGRNLSIDAGVNFGPANDALLLAAGYLNDLYMLVGNEAYADAANPTIGIGTKDREYGSIATALFAFRGQVPSLLEEELALLRGRDDVALPGVETAPVYNRLFWNFTRGIDAGEVIYALNYNILDQNSDGKADAADAAKLYPQGHGDAYGHYLTAVKGYYSLLINPNFEWVPRIEAVTVLGKPISVDYLDERKFAAGAAAVARTGRQIVDLTWRQHYLGGRTTGWEHLSTNRVSQRVVTNGTATVNLVRHWGVDQWASRSCQGAYLNWIVGNAILPEVDPDPSHEGIQKVDRTTVPELLELGTTVADLMATIDNVEGRLTPVGLTEGSIAFDLNPSQVNGEDPKPHFEQVYDRAKLALNNALAAFDDAKDVTRLMRSEEDSLADLRATLAEQELAFTNALIEIYGTPYPDDVGPGKTYKQGYEGPDLFHYVYVENPELKFGRNLDPTTNSIFLLDVQSLPSSWVVGTQSGKDAFDFFDLYDPSNPNSSPPNKFIKYELSPHGYFQKPAAWTGKRRSPGEIQQAISDIIKARNTVAEAMAAGVTKKQLLNGLIRQYKAGEATKDTVTRLEEDLAAAEQITASLERVSDVVEKTQEVITSGIEEASEAIIESLPKSFIVGLAAGGDVTSPARGAVKIGANILVRILQAVTIARTAVVAALRTANDAAAVGVDFQQIRPAERRQERLEALVELDAALRDLQDHSYAINQALRELDDAERALAALVAKGDRIQAERQVVRQRTAAIIQGFRTRDAAFRIFRNEKLERYKTLFDLAARFSFLAANAYDYDTGLLGTEKGRAFVNRVVSSRALGVVRDGEPQYAGSNTGDPGLSSALAEMKADFDVLKGRLGFNSPDAYSTLASIRTGNLRILPDTNGISTWQDYLQQSRMDNILEDADVRRYCQQADPGNGLPVPGIVITFSTSINPNESLFGKPLAAGDSAFHRSSFATKIHSVGVALEGYRGMNTPGLDHTSDPNLSYLDPLALAANPFVYLIPVGADIMRSPPLGDTSTLRQWKVDDVAIPLPFNIGGSGFSTKNFYQSSDSLTEPLFTIRKHQAFRPTDSIQAFEAGVYDAINFSQYTNRRLIGRSVWNTQWKLVIPGDTLLADPKEGLSRFIQTVSDIKLYFTTYSYSGN
jgi:hypothetical protein